MAPKAKSSRLPAQSSSEETYHGSFIKVDDDTQAERLQPEERLHLLAREHFEDLGLDAALIGFGVGLKTTKKPDILAVDSEGRLCVVEFK
jgi:hypothetical protein